MEQQSQKREVEEPGYQTQTGPTLCANNCGFFGSAATNNLCSKCYRDHFLKQSKSISPAPLLVTAAEKKPVFDPVVGPTTEGSSTSQEDPTKRPPNRCSFCNKRVGLNGFKCRCEQTFCSTHRYSDKHNCVYDYKRAGQDAIAKANPVVKADKVDKI